MSRKLNVVLIDAMRDNNAFRTDGFSLREGFAGDYQVEKVAPFKSRRAKNGEADNFTVTCKSPKGIALLSGFQIANARILATDVLKAAPVKAGVWYQDEIKDEINQSVVFNSLFKDNTDYEFPATLKIVGASVIRDEATKQPMIPMRRYKYYQQCLNHHRNVVKDPEAFMTREEFAAYLKVTGENRPLGVPEEVKIPTLSATTKADDMGNWSFTLLLADVAQA